MTPDTIRKAAEELLNAIIAADPNVEQDFKSSDYIIRSLYNKAKKLVKQISRFHSQQPQQGMRWVKASERLPGNGLVHYREEGGLNDVVFYSTKHGFYKPKAKRGDNKKLMHEIGKITKPLDQIYWLDETPSAEPEGRDEWVRLEELKRANDILRSCHSVVERRGASTNWESLEKKIKEILTDQHKLIYPPNPNTKH